MAGQEGKGREEVEGEGHQQVWYKGHSEGASALWMRVSAPSAACFLTLHRPRLHRLHCAQTPPKPPYNPLHFLACQVAEKFLDEAQTGAKALA